MSKPVWFVKFPTWKYEENVKELAAKNGLKIIDARHQGGRKQCENAPTLTYKPGLEPESKFDAQLAISNLANLKADDLKKLAIAADIEYTNVDETRAALKEKYDV